MSPTILGLVIVVLICAPAFAAPDVTVLVIAKAGRTNYDIVTDRAAPPGVNEAAKELQRVVIAATGTRLPVVSVPSEGRNHIFLGVGPWTASANIDLSSLPLDGFRVWVRGNNLFLVGRDDDVQPFYGLNNDRSASAGTYNAVIEFARRFVGANWFLPGDMGEEIPEMPVLSVPATLNIEGKPRFAIRYIDVTLYRGAGREQPLVVRGQMSRSYFDERSARAATAWGRRLRLGQNKQLELGHSWYLWMPAESPTAYSSKYYGKTNPGFFAVPGGRMGRYYNGSDNAHGGQLCIVNPEVSTEMARNIVRYGRRTGLRNFGLSPNDGGWECAASCCGSRIPSGPIGNVALRNELAVFANAVAKHVVSELPDARFGLLAYDWTLEPPTREHTGSNIDISDVYNGLPFRLQVPEERNRVKRLIQSWRVQADSVVLTTYYTYEGFYSLPWSTADEQDWVIKLLARFPASSGLRMNYAQLDTPPIGSLGPDPWILAQLLWDPAQSVEDLKNEFYMGAFGPIAGPLVRQYFAELSRSMKETVGRLPFTEDSANHVVAYVLPAYGAVRVSCRELIRRAVNSVAAGPERYRWRVDRIARGWRLAEVTLDAMAAEQAGLRGVSERLWKQRRELLADPDSRFALAPSSTDFMDQWVPLSRH